MNIPLDMHLCFKLYVASRLIVQSFADVMTSLKLTYPKYLVLTALSEADGQTVGSLGQRLSLDSGTLSPLLKSLESQAYITRRRSTKDDRVVANFITKDGRRARDKAMAAAAEIFCRTEMAPEQFDTLRSGLDDFIARCHQLLAEPAVDTSPAKARKAGKAPVKSHAKPRLAAPAPRRAPRRRTAELSGT